MISINIINQFDDNETYEIVIEDIINQAYKQMKMINDVIINIILVDNQTIQQLNNQFRFINQATDVLSFENQDIEEELGDIFISIDKVISQSKEYQHSFERELAFLTLHGFLHCNGYDHLTTDDEIEMFKLQNEIIESSKYRRSNHYEK